MYIQITTRCNMSCNHCCYSCTTQGEDMNLETFKAALQDEDECVSIGGGEPTIHPLFWQFLGMTIAQTEYPWLATNGKETETALALAKMAKRGVIGCALSLDEYHDFIAPEVISAFTREKPEHYSQTRSEDYREIRDVTAGDKEPFISGRCEEGKEGCCCEDTFVCPDGTVKQCGCIDSTIIGNVFDSFEPLENEDGDFNCCYKTVKTEEV